MDLVSPRLCRIGSAVLVAAIVSVSTAVGARAQESPADKRAFSIHGYGEAHYNSVEPGTMDESRPAQMDIHRMVLGWEYEFTPDLRMSAEVDFEHAASDIELEYAHLEYDLAPAVSLRMGSLLMPVGPLNEFHEPPTYHSVERPYLEQFVIPTTWQEIGAGVVGRASNGALGYRAYIVSGLDAMGFDSEEGIREGRQHGAEAKAEDLALVGRLEYAAKGGLSIGGSGYVGGADQGAPALGNVTVSIAETDARFRRGALDLRAEAVRIRIDQTDAPTGLGGEIPVSRTWGANGEIALDLLHGRAAVEGRALWLFGRFERFDTNDAMRGVSVPDPAEQRSITTAGIAYHPVREVAFKADFERWENGAGTRLNRLNVGAAFQF